MKIKHVYGNVLKLDIPLTIKIRTMEGDVPTEREEPFYPDAAKGCIVELANNYNRKIQYDATVSGNVAHIEDDGIISIGTYKVTVKCHDEYGNPYRYMVRDIVEICDATIDAGIEAGVEFNAETYTLDGAVFVSYGGEQVQSDWAETDPEEKSFIKNKPDLTQYATKNELREVESEIPTLPDHIVTDEHYVHTDNNYTTEEKTKLAGLENYDDTNVLNLIEQTNQNFANYYTKQQTYSQSEVNQLLETQRQGQYVMVEELPTASVDTMFKIYLVPSSDPQTSNIKDEYITIDNGSEATTRYTWEKIGSTAIDLSAYSTTEEMNAAIQQALASYYTKTEADALLGGKQDTISDLSTIRSGAAAGATAVQPEAGKGLFSGSYNDLTDKPTIPTTLSQLSEDATHRTVSDTEKTTWGNKQDTLVSGTNIKTINNQSILGSGNITIQGGGSSVQSDWNQTDTEADDYIKNKPTIPSALSQLSEDTTHRVVSDTEKTTWNNKSNFSGSYNDLTDKPTIPAEQVQSDWNQTNNSSKDFIKNKPTIPTVPTNVSAFNNDAGYLTQHQDISGKADKSEMSVVYGTGTDADKTTITLKTGTSATVLKSHQSLSGKQDVIDSSHKLSADLVDDTNTTNKFTNATEKQTWNNKQDALVSGTNIKTINNESILGSGNITIQGGGGSQVQSDWNQSDNTAVDYIKNKPTIPVIPSNTAYLSSDSGEGIIPSDGIRAVTVTSAATMTISPDVVTVIDGAVGTSTITLAVPQDNLAHVWDILMTTDSTVAITFAMSNSATILTPSEFSIGASKAVEISVIGIGTKYYLRYGEFA